ncbi:MAG: ribonuclease P protein component [Alphaproteobacteria bacterium]|nr:ribonuclease P protein component [Alphaproteobacteria bacterium]
MERLKKRSDYLIVTKAGQRFVTPAFILQVHHKTSENAARIGFTASRKVGSAVERNRAKRRLRALAHQFLTPLACQGTDYVLIARKEALTRAYALMAEDLQKALAPLIKRNKI